ncbi:hypothetical protein ACHAWX_001167 [Stephanocyclus meneghinianus]
MKFHRVATFIHIACFNIAAAYPQVTTHLVSPFRRVATVSSSSSLCRLSASTASSPPTSPSKRQFSTLHRFSTRIQMGRDITDYSLTNINPADTNENPLSQHSLPFPLILGSASFTRKLILREMQIPFHILVRPIDEKTIGDRSDSERPDHLVLMVARAKMDHLVDMISRGECDEDLPTTSASSTPTDNSHEKGWVILTGDQVITCADQILEKPTSIEEAKRFIQMYATNPPSTVGSVILTHYPSGITVEGTDRATIYFKETVCETIPVATPVPDGATFTKEMDLVDRLLQEDAPILSCAGGLMIEHPLVREHIDRIDGTEDSVMGLSKTLVIKLLGELTTKLNQTK